MHVTLINPPQVFSRFQVAAGITPPLGVAYLAAYLLKHDIEVDVVDALGEAPGNVTPFEGRALLRGLDLDATCAAVPDHTELVGISNLFTFAWPAVTELAKRIKARLPEVPIIVGGPHPSSLPEEALAEPWIDYVGLGEGEEPLRQLCVVLSEGGDLEELEAIAWRRPDGTVVARKQTTKTLIRAVETIPFPARHLLPMEAYITTQEAHGPVGARWTSILSSRGCPYGCTFCESRLTRWRARPAADVVDEIEECSQRWGIEEFHFEDDNMTISGKRIVEIAAELKRRGLGIRWQTPNGIRASVTDQATLRAMRDSGCEHITLAPESGSVRVLQEIVQKGKDFELDQLVRVAVDARALGMKTAAYFILGLPGERLEDIEATIAYARELARVGVDEVGFGLFIPLPGTPLWDEVADKLEGLDYLDLLAVDDLDASVSFNDELTDDDLKRLRRRAYATFFLTRARHHPAALGRTLANVLRSRQELKTDRVLINLWQRMRDRIDGDDRPAVLAYPYDAARTVRILLDTQGAYSFRHSLRKTLALLVPRGRKDRSSP